MGRERVCVCHESHEPQYSAHSLLTAVTKKLALCVQFHENCSIESLSVYQCHGVCPSHLKIYSKRRQKKVDVGPGCSIRVGSPRTGRSPTRTIVMRVPYHASRHGACVSSECVRTSCRRPPPPPPALLVAPLCPRRSLDYCCRRPPPPPSLLVAPLRPRPPSPPLLREDQCRGHAPAELGLVLSFCTRSCRARAGSFAASCMHGRQRGHLRTRTFPPSVYGSVPSTPRSICKASTSRPHQRERGREGRREGESGVNDFASVRVCVKSVYMYMDLGSRPGQNSASDPRTLEKSGYTHCMN